MTMLKTVTSFSLLFFCSSYLFAQTLTVDPVLTGATIVGGVNQNNRLDDMKEKQTAIQHYQALAVTQLAFINTWQKKMYDGLSQVSSVIRDSKKIVEAGMIVNDIISYQLQAAQYAKGNPVLVYFAAKTEADFKTKALDLVLYISTVGLKGGKDMLMDAGQRAELITKVVDDLRVIRGLAYTASRQMYWAKMDGVFRSLNPYATFLNQDKQLADEILSSYKF